jgi:hypothetical protein
MFLVLTGLAAFIFVFLCQVGSLSDLKVSAVCLSETSEALRTANYKTNEREC